MYSTMLDENHYADPINALDLMSGGKQRARENLIQSHSYTLDCLHHQALVEEADEGDGTDFSRQLLYNQRKQCLMHILSCDFAVDGAEPVGSPKLQSKQDSSLGSASLDQESELPRDPLKLDSHENSFELVARW